MSTLKYKSVQYQLEYLLLRKTPEFFIWPAILFHLVQTANISETQIKTKVEYFKLNIQ